MQLLGGDEGEAGTEIEAHLVPEHAQSSRAGAILAAEACVSYAPEKFEILLHGSSSGAMVSAESAAVAETRVLVIVRVA
jgi:hypothetical protein